MLHAEGGEPASAGVWGRLGVQTGWHTQPDGESPCLGVGRVVASGSLGAKVRVRPAGLASGDKGRWQALCWLDWRGRGAALPEPGVGGGGGGRRPLGSS